MKKTLIVITFIFISLLFPTFVKAEDNVSVIYQSHVSYVGWQNEVKDGVTSGTTGQSRQMEAIKIRLSDINLGSINYSSYIQDTGWTSWAQNGDISGTTGQSKRIEAIKIKLDENLSNSYDVYYRVHVQSTGWMGWTKNGETAGTTGYNRRIEAIEIKIVDKNSAAPGSTQNSYNEKYSVSYQSHISNVGWQSQVSDGVLSGTTGQSKRLEAIKINLVNKNITGSITYQSYVQGVGWQSQVSNDAVSGTTGQSKRIEAIKINLTGEYKQKFDIYYRVHVQNIGWMDWTKNGNAAGTIGYNYRIEAIEIRLISKNGKTPGDETNPYLEKESTLTYQTHVQSNGWLSYVNKGKISGTTGQSKRIEAFRIKVSNETENNMISYQSHVSNVGWMSWVTGTNISGTTGQSKPIEAIKIKLSGDLANKYDIYYRVHVQNIGWMSWAKNGEAAGTTGAGYRVEALEIELVKKGETFKEDQKNPYMEAKWVTESDGNKYYYDVYGNKVTGEKKIGNTTHYFGPTGIYLGNNKLKILDVSYHQGSIDWNKVASSGIYGVILRIGYWNTEDARFSEYISEVKRLNIPYGIYLFSYASTTSGAQTEANFTNNMVSKYNLNPTLGIYYDVEDWYVASDNNSNILSKNDYDNIIRTYLNSVRSYVGNKYNVKVYANLNYANNKFNDYARSEIDWIAHYNSTCGYKGSYSMWQYTSSEQINGVNGYVDMSYLYK